MSVPDELLEQLRSIVQQCSPVSDDVTGLVLGSLEDMRATQFRAYMTSRMEHDADCPLRQQLTSELVSLTHASHEELTGARRRHLEAAQAALDQLTSLLRGVSDVSARMLRSTVARAKLLFHHSDYIEMLALHNLVETR